MINRTSKWHQKNRPLSVGDVVIICDSAAPRNTWDKGIVVDVKQDNSGQVRSASVKTSHGILTRPAVKIAKLDVYNEPVTQDVTRGSVTDRLNLAP